jgi:cobalamin biosynthesis Mg chelatase CobN
MGLPARQRRAALLAALAVLALAPAAGAQSTPTPAPATSPTSSTPAPATTPAPAPAPQAAPGTDQAVSSAARANQGRSTPAAVVALVVGVAALLLLLGLWALARWTAFEPPWVPRWRHAAAEAGWRSSLAWADFRDWLRFGR